MPSKYEDAEEQRQKVLDFLIANPGSPLYRIAWHLDILDERAAQLLGRMEQLEEVSRTDEGVSRRGFKCAAWYAEVTKTVTATDIVRHVAGNLKGPGKGRKIVRFGEKRRIEKPKPQPVARLFGGL